MYKMNAFIKYPPPTTATPAPLNSHMLRTVWQDRLAHNLAVAAPTTHSGDRAPQRAQCTQLKAQALQHNNSNRHTTAANTNSAEHNTAKHKELEVQRRTNAVHFSSPLSKHCAAVLYKSNALF